MSNLSEEEILNKITEMINELRDDINRVEDWVNTGEDEEKLETLEGILDLYNKEKEKNNTLEELLQGKLFELYKYYKDLASSYQANSISKDKIRELLEKLDKEEKQELKGVKGQDRYFIKQLYQAQKNVVQELLEVE